MLNMTQRGRKSPLKLVEMAVGDICPRPVPPAELSDEEAAEWVALCNSLSPDYFTRPTHATLAQCCRHVVIARRLAELIHRLEKRKKFDERRYARLIKEHRAETLAITNCLRALRLTHLSIKPSSRSPIPASPLPRPWLG
jgi:hypothetical protein